LAHGNNNSYSSSRLWKKAQAWQGQRNSDCPMLTARPLVSIIFPSLGQFGNAKRSSWFHTARSADGLPLQCSKDQQLDFGSGSFATG
jgi:hypothetical protein